MIDKRSSTESPVDVWNSPVPQERWRGFRSRLRGVEAFSTKENFEQAQCDELRSCFSVAERGLLARLLERGQKTELEVFIRTRGCNPIFDPEATLDVSVGIARADHVHLSQAASQRANESILRGDVVHVLFQAGEASRFNQGPFYDLDSLACAREMGTELTGGLLDQIDRVSNSIDPGICNFIRSEKLGPKQPVFIRAAIRRVIQAEINAGRLNVSNAISCYTAALRNQKLLFFVSKQGQVAALHDDVLRRKYEFFGFDPQNIVTIEQDLLPGLVVAPDGNVELLKEPWSLDAAGHMYALLQATRTGDFIAYSSSGNLLRLEAEDALNYLSEKGGKILSIIRINDMDRHTTEIVNPKALEYALCQFSMGYVNVIESVSNPTGQKGGTGLTFGQMPQHFLTETHENSFPVLSRAVEAAMKTYREVFHGQHPAYNAMRQWADLQMTRRTLKQIGGRVVFVPRQKTVGNEIKSYIGVDMPMGDLSLLAHACPSRMFQFVGEHGRELCIHDVKLQTHVNLLLETILFQLKDPHILQAVEELVQNKILGFSPLLADTSLYGAPAPELMSQ